MTKFLFYNALIFFALSTAAQNNQPTQQNKNETGIFSTTKTDYISQQGYLLPSSVTSFLNLYGDSLQGFNESLIKTELLNKGISGNEFHGHIAHLKRQFIAHKYQLIKNDPLISHTQSGTKHIGTGNTINVAPCVNEDFELTAPGPYSSPNAVVGWTLNSRSADSQCNPLTWSPGSSEFSVVSTPIYNFPGAGTIPHSPLGGAVVVQLNNSSPNYQCTKLSQSFPVMSSNSLFTFAFAGYWQDGGSGHSCCDQPYFRVLVKDCSGTLLSCSSLSLNATSGCGNAVPGYTVDVVGNFWSNWQMRTIDLTPYIGTCVTIEAISTDCAFGGHYGTTLFDSQCGNQSTPFWNTGTGVSSGNAVSFCPGSTQAILQAPLGYATYSWIPPASHPSLSASQATQALLTTSNALPGNTFTVNITTASGCAFTRTIAVVYSSVAIVGIGSSPSCSLGSSGSATVLSTGSGTGYNYTWLNATNSVIATSSVITNLSIGAYSVIVTAIGSPSCGSASNSIAVSLAPANIITIARPFCPGGVAYLTSPSATGTNHQWYNGLTAISPTLGGNASSYTVASPVNLSIYWLSYITNQGCRDSVKYTLGITSPGSIVYTAFRYACYGTNSGSATITLLPSIAASGVNNTFSLFSTGPAPSYSTTSSTSSSIFTPTNLSGSVTYSINASDGVCNYGGSFVVGSHPLFNFSLSPSNSPTLCSGNSLLGGVVLPGLVLPSEYTYSWSPTTYLFGNNGQQQQVLITPTAAPGSVNTIIYTVAVTSTAQSCTQNSTLAISAVNFITPTISPIPIFCVNSPVFTVSANPSGGQFIGGNNISSGGVITPSLVTQGSHNFIYTMSSGLCSVISTASFVVSPLPNITISGNTVICKGQSTTLLASGASYYNWLTIAAGPFITVSPTTITTYTIDGLNINTNCSNTATIAVNVLPLPSLVIDGDSLLCEGESIILTVSGASTYSWSTGSVSNSIVIAPNTNTNYTVTGVSNQNACANSKEISVSVLPCSGISAQNLSGEVGVGIYPNPTKGLLYLEIENEITCSIHDGLGKSIFEKHLLKGKETLDMSTFASGVYFLTFKSPTKSQVIKVVKMD
jgi:hypothetical protein